MLRYSSSLVQQFIQNRMDTRRKDATSATPATSPNKLGQRQRDNRSQPVRVPIDPRATALSACQQRSRGRNTSSVFCRRVREEAYMLHLMTRDKPVGRTPRVALHAHQQASPRAESVIHRPTDTNRTGQGSSTTTHKHVGLSKTPLSKNLPRTATIACL